MLLVILMLMLGISLAEEHQSATQSPVSAVSDKTVFCYWETWRYPGFTSEHIDASLCSTVIYGYGELLTDTWTLSHKNKTIDLELGGFYNMTEMKRKNPHLRFEVALGEWQTPERFYAMAGDPEKRSSFISSSILYLTNHGFDGLHLHWGSPDPVGDDPVGDNTSTDRRHLSTLLKDIKAAFQPVRLTISLVIWSPISSKIDENFKVDEVYKHADLVFINVFFYHGNWEKLTGAYAPLYNRGRSTDKLTVEASWQHLQYRGAVACKTVLVFPAKGNGFHLEDPKSAEMGARAVPGHLVAGTQPLFNQICLLMKNSSWSKVWDEERRVPYIHLEEQWISYDDRQSVREKVEYANMEGMAGVAVNDLAMDDFTGNCFNVTFPLLREALAVQKTGDCPVGGGPRLGSGFGVVTFLLIIAIV